jgi:SAM-dependent methyltransferase
LRLGTPKHPVAVAARRTTIAGAKALQRGRSARVMRPQDWAFLAAMGAAVWTVTTAMRGAAAGALAGIATTAAAVWTARVLSRRFPAPMHHMFRWGLLWPRGFHSPRRLRDVLQPRSGERILELGPGIGIHALAVAVSLAPAGTLDVLDIQQPMLDHLVRRAARARVLNIASVVGDARRLPYSSASFDGAYLIDVLGETPDVTAVLQELRRVLRPAGRLVVGEHFVDPDFVSLRSLKERAETAGFTFEYTRGISLVFFARFRRT